jgi:hypothetical protein
MINYWRSSNGKERRFRLFYSPQINSAAYLHTTNSSHFGYTAYGIIFPAVLCLACWVLTENHGTADRTLFARQRLSGIQSSVDAFQFPDSWSPFGDGGLNSCGYCLGDPINRRDPTGHSILLKSLMMFTEKRATPLGSLQSFAGTPHVLEKIAGNLSGPDLEFFQASTVTCSIAQKFIEPLGI